MAQYQGFLIKKDNGIIVVNSKKTTSIITNQLQLDYLQDTASEYIKGKLLDLGCGEKPYKLVYDHLCESSIGIDVETCKHEQKYVDVFASADQIPFADETFHTVLCTNVLEHVPDMEKAFSEISRVLKKGGHLIISIPFLYPVHESPYDFYRYTIYGIRHQLGQNGFEIKREMTWGGAGTLICVYLHLFLGKVVKAKWIRHLSCLSQKAAYFFIKKCCYKRMLSGKGKMNKVITLGNFVIAQKNA